MNPVSTQQLDRPAVQDGQTYANSAVGKTKAQTVADVINRCRHRASESRRNHGLEEQGTHSIAASGSEPDALVVLGNRIEGTQAA